MIEKINYESIYIQHANSTIDWCPMDNKEIYESNYKKKYNMLLENGWINSTVSYTFNKHGFRCPNFSNDPCIMFLGCSMAVGIGVNIEQTWLYNVAKHYNLALVNLGQGGASNDTAFRLGYYWIPKLKPKIVFFMKPSKHRLEIITDLHIHNLIPNLDYKAVLPEFKDFYVNWLGEPTNPEMNFLKNELAIKKLCDDHGCVFAHDSAVRWNFEDRIDLARDLIHPGVKTHQLIAQDAINRINAAM